MSVNRKMSIIAYGVFVLCVNLCMAFEKTDSGVTLTLPNTETTGVKTLKIKVLSPDIIHVLGLPEKITQEPLSLVVDNPSLPQTPFKVSKKSDGLHILTETLDLLINQKTGQITFKNTQGDLLLAEDAREITPDNVCDENVYNVKQSFDWRDDEALYGLGQHQEGLYNWRGKYVELFQYNKRAIVPFLLSTKGYGLFWDNYSYTRFDNTGANESLWSEVGDAVNYYFFHGPGSDAVINNYRQLTGPAPLFPKWAYGYIQSKERYKSQDEILAIAKEHRDRQIPMDVIVLDWRYWDDGHWGQKSFNADRFPDPSTMMRTLHDTYHTHLMISIWPKMSIRTANHKEMSEHPGFLYSPTTKDSFYDSFNPEARDLYWKQAYEGIFSKGIDAWWCDATEPEVDDWDFNIDGYKRNMKPSIGSGGRYMNAYSLMHSKGMYENQRRVTSEKRVVNLTRSAFAGQQKYATITWSGDINATWEVLRAQIPAGLNFCMSGLPYWTMDIGGFFVQSANVGQLGNGKWFREGGYDKGIEDDNYKELYVRWFQYGAFCPIFRSHGTDISREIWQFGEPGDWAYDALLKFDNLRYRLMPYLYSQAWQVTNAGYTMMRGLAMDFRQDAHVFDIEDQFMFGPAIMVSPITTPKDNYRYVYLPEGADWIDFWIGKQYSGGQTLQVPAPIDNMPLYVKAGSIIPMSPVIQHAAEATDTIELRIYPGANGHFVLYEDEGDNYNYEKGNYTTVDCQWNDAEKTLTLGAIKGDFPGRMNSKEFRIILVSKGSGVGVKETTIPNHIIQYNGKRQVISIK